MICMPASSCHLPLLTHYFILVADGKIGHLYLELYIHGKQVARNEEGLRASPVITQRIWIIY